MRLVECDLSGCNLIIILKVCINIKFLIISVSSQPDMNFRNGECVVESNRDIGKLLPSLILVSLIANST